MHIVVVIPVCGMLSSGNYPEESIQHSEHGKSWNHISLLKCLHVSSWGKMDGHSHNVTTCRTNTNDSSVETVHLDRITHVKSCL